MTTIADVEAARIERFTDILDDIRDIVEVIGGFDMEHVRRVRVAAAFEDQLAALTAIDDVLDDVMTLCVVAEVCQ